MWPHLALCLTPLLSLHRPIKTENAIFSSALCISPTHYSLTHSDQSAKAQWQWCCRLSPSSESLIRFPLLRLRRELPKRTVPERSERGFQEQWSKRGVPGSLFFLAVKFFALLLIYVASRGTVSPITTLDCYVSDLFRDRRVSANAFPPLLTLLLLRSRSFEVNLNPYRICIFLVYLCAPFGSWEINHRILIFSKGKGIFVLCEGSWLRLYLDSFAFTFLSFLFNQTEPKDLCFSVYMLCDCFFGMSFA